MVGVSTVATTEKVVYNDAVPFSPSGVLFQ
jgi:hypothetical protein